MINKSCLFFEIISKRFTRIWPLLPAFPVRFQSSKHSVTQIYSKCASVLSSSTVNKLNLTSLNRLSRSVSSSTKDTEFDCDEESESVDDFERVFENLTVDKYKELIKNETDEENIKNILESYEYSKYTEEYVPSTITIKDMKRLMALKPRGYTDFFRYLYKNEIMRLKNEKEKEERKMLVLEKRRNMNCESKVGIEYDKESGAPIYGLWRNSLYIYMPPVVCRSSANPKLLASQQFCPPLVFDFDFDHEMNPKEVSITVRHMKMLISSNRSFDYPFNIWFCNYKHNTKTHEWLSKDTNFLSSLNFINITEKSYLDLFPRKKLIYLTADSKRKMQEFDHDAIYIIGAVLDDAHKKRLTLEKARREGIKTLRLPLDDYVVMRKSKDLFLTEMVNTLNEQKISGDWRESLKHLKKNRVWSEADIKEMESKKMEAMKSKLEWSRKRIRGMRIDENES